jgi:hypothetical protein
MKDAFEMGSVATIYVPSFIQTASDIQKLVRVVTDPQTHTDSMYNISLPSFF